MKKEIEFNPVVAEFLQNVDNVDVFVNGAIQSFIQDNIVVDEIDVVKNDIADLKLDYKSTQDMLIFIMDLLRTTQTNSIVSRLHSIEMSKKLIDGPKTIVNDEKFREIASEEYKKAKEYFFENN